MPSIDLYCLLIFITSQDSTTALPVSCISYSLSSSPWLSFALLHPWTLFLRLIWKSSLSLSLSHISLLSVTFHRSLSDVVSLVSLCCVYLMVDLSSRDGSFLSSRCEQLCASVCFLSRPPPREKCPDHFSDYICCVYFVITLFLLFAIGKIFFDIQHLHIFIWTIYISQWSNISFTVILNQSVFMCMHVCKKFLMVFFCFCFCFLTIVYMYQCARCTDWRAQTIYTFRIIFLLKKLRLISWTPS